MVDYSDIEFEFPPNGYSNRGAYRASFDGIFARVKGNVDILEIIDISATGCSIDCEAVKFGLNRMLTIDIIIAKRAIVKSLQIEVVRLLSDFEIACAFRELTRHQEYDLDKLTLEVQKCAISSIRY